MKFSARVLGFLIVVAMILFLSQPLLAQGPVDSAPPSKETQDQKEPEHGFTAYASFEGSSNTDGQVMTFTSSAGYIFNKHFAVDMGLPVFFVRGTDAAGTKTTSRGIGDAFADLRFTFNNPILNYASSLTVAAPSGSTSKGRSTGRATFDWGNEFSRSFGRWTPFANLGVGNSLYNTRFFHRPFLTLGKVAHFEGGTAFDLGHSLSVSASAYDVAPWGQQKVFSRIVTKSSGGPGGAVRHGRVFENNAVTIGSADLVRDNGFNTALDFQPLRFLTFEIGYSRSIHFQLNTVSFGVGVNLRSLVHRTSD